MLSACWDGFTCGSCNTNTTPHRKCALFVFHPSEPMDFWSTIEKTLKFSQTAAILEIVHSMLGLVRSPVMTTTLQGICHICKVV